MTTELIVSGYNISVLNFIYFFLPLSNAVRTDVSKSCWSSDSESIIAIYILKQVNETSVININIRGNLAHGAIHSKRACKKLVDHIFHVIMFN